MQDSDPTIITGGHVLDPVNGVDGVSDILIRRGRIERLAESVQRPGGVNVIDASGTYVMPGHIDLHAHVSSAWQRNTDRAVGHRMLVESGTTTILDLAGEPNRMIEGMRRDGAGLNVATLLGLIPHETIKEDDPRPPAVRDAIGSTLEQGAIGVKLLGGYHPFTPEATADVVSVANEMGAWVAYHVGSKDSGSHIDGLREVPGIVGNGRLHVAHINSYCRGLIMSAPEESNEALRILGGMRGQVVTEAYLAQQNGTNGLCDEDGNVVYNVAQNCLVTRGYPTNEEGLRQAMRDGYCSALKPEGDRIVLVTGDEAIKIWESAQTAAGLSFPVNPASTAYTLTTARHDDGDWAIDAVSTDGGALPRNVSISRTFALVGFGALSPLEAADKLSYRPSRAFGLLDKGHFSEGADADVTIVDRSTGTATMSLVAGKPIMVDGKAVAKGGTWLVTAAGEGAARASGLPYQVIDLEQSKLYEGW